MDKKLRQKTVCLTGGHLSPALSVIEEIRKQKKPWNLVFVGRYHTSQGNDAVSAEKRLIEKEHIPFFSIHAGRLSRYISFSAVIEFFTIPIGFLEACWFCIRNRPDCIISFGGYVGLPVVVAGWLFAIPSVIHEQTHSLGLANSIASHFVDSVLLTFADTRGIKAMDTATVTGLPVRQAFQNPPKKPSFMVPGDKPILYITGGTTGAVSLNELLFPIIEAFTKSYMVIHQTGQMSYEKALGIKKHLSEHTRPYYVPFSYIESADVAWIMHHMTVLLGRSGANTTVETAMLHKPAVFVPLPWSGSNEQNRNALWFQSIGDATIINQQTATPQEIYRAVLGKKDGQMRRQNREHASLPTNAAASVVAAITAVLQAP